MVLYDKVGCGVIGLGKAGNIYSMWFGNVWYCDVWLCKAVMVRYGNVM